VSYFDAAAEGFFHGLTLGFLAALRRRFRVLSNIESGEGRFDIALKPLVDGFPAFIIEVKKADGSGDDLKALARAARAQIDGKKYDATFRAEGVVNIEKIGLAYYKDKVELCRE
ncbi:MAG: PD-(D/E)XK nuclease domain-containing protein, partial [bacterium]|nr:PD-(D/E)XK nuclease domain-containing protein [bacterium]